MTTSTRLTDEGVSAVAAVAVGIRNAVYDRAMIRVCHVALRRVVETLVFTPYRMTGTTVLVPGLTERSDAAPTLATVESDDDDEK